MIYNKIHNFIIVTVSIATISIVARAQANIGLHYLDSLSKELFLEDTTKLAIYNCPSCEEKDYWHLMLPYNVDSTARVRVNQPNLVKVSRILERIMYTKDFSYYEPLMLIYNEHQENFKNEWASSFFKYNLL